LNLNKIRVDVIGNETRKEPEKNNFIDFDKIVSDRHNQEKIQEEI